MSETPVIECLGLSRTYRDGDINVQVLEGIDFRLGSAERVAIVGASGAGKSTLLNLLGGLDLPSSGQVLFRGQDWARLAESQRCQLRNRDLGFVYQFHHLLPEFSASENVAMPLMIAGRNRRAAQDQASALLAREAKRETE